MPPIDILIAAVQIPAFLGVFWLFLHGRGGFRTCDLSRVKRGRSVKIVAYLQGENRI
jgi:hypothetical protein